MIGLDEGKYTELRSPPAVVPPAVGEITLRDLFVVLVRRWRIIALTSVAMMALMAAFMVLQKPEYLIEAVVTQRLDREQPERSIGSLGAALLGNQPAVSDVFLRFIALLRAPNTVEALPNLDGIMSTVFANSWDREHKTWVSPRGLVSRIAAGIDQFFGLPPWKPPVARDLAEFLAKELKAESVDRTPIYRISFEWRDPQFGVALLSALIKSADNQIRSRTAVDLKERERYIGQELDRAQKLEERQALARIFADTILGEATLYDTPTYSVNVVQQPTASTRPISPRPVLYLVLAGLGGVVMGIFIIVALAIGRGLPD